MPLLIVRCTAGPSAAWAAVEVAPVSHRFAKRLPKTKTLARPTALLPLRQLGRFAPSFVVTFLGTFTAFRSLCNRSQRNAILSAIVRGVWFPVKMKEFSY